MKLKIFFLLATTLFMIVAAGLLYRGAWANSQPLYRIDFWTMDGGGARVSEGNLYSLQGTIGQSEAQLASWSVPDGEDGYRLIGGFWGLILAQTSLFLPLIIR